jgi:hypothetical protein
MHSEMENMRISITITESLDKKADEMKVESEAMGNLIYFL